MDLIEQMTDMQAQEDTRYAQAVTGYKEDCKKWIRLNEQNRAAGLPVTPFTTPLPVRAVYSLDEDKILTEYVTATNLQPPVLP